MPRGVPWESIQSRGTFNTAPQASSEEWLPAVAFGAPVPSGWGPWLYSEPAFSRYTIVTLDQPEDVSALPQASAASHAWSITRAAVSSWRARRPTATADDVSDLRGLPPPRLYFDMAEPPVRGKVPHSALLNFARVHDDALPGIGFAVLFVLAGAGRIDASGHRYRTAVGLMNATLSPKDPESNEYFGRDCARIIQSGAGGTIAGILAEFWEEGDGACVVTIAAAIDSSGLRWSAKISGGTEDVTYRYTVRILTTAGETLDTSIVFTCVNAIH